MRRVQRVIEVVRAVGYVLALSVILAREAASR